MTTIPTNLPAMTAATKLDRTQELLSRSLSRLSAGTKIVTPADDSAGLALAASLNAQSLRVTAASTNVQNAISSVQTSDSFLASMGSVLSRLGELSSLSQDPTKSTSDLALYQQEFASLQDQLRSTIGGTTAQIGGTSDVTDPLGTFNGQQLFGATAGGGQTLDIGQAPGQAMTIPDVNLRGGSMLALIGQDSSGQYTTQATDADAVTKITAAVQQLAASRATLGAAESRLNLASTALQVEGQNMTSALSSIQDVDVATESTQYAKYNILVQSSTAMLAQANQDPAAVLQLLHA